MARAKLCGVLTDVRGAFVNDNKINATGKHGIRLNPDSTHSLVQYGSRDLKKFPYTENETAQKQSFAAAAQLAKVVRTTPSVKADWMERFQAQTKYNTFNGYLMAMAMKGHVSESGDWA